MTASAEVIPSGPINAELSVPGSKSITNRALVCAALADGESTIAGASLSGDSRRMIEALGRLGVAVAVDGTTVRVRGGRRPSGDARFDFGNAGTTLRFMTSMLCLGEGTFVVDGSARMRERPIGPLVDGLRALGADIRYLGAEGFPPLEIRAHGLKRGRVRVAADESSQFASSLLLVGADIELARPAVSEPYIAMTRRVIAAFGGGACAFAVEGDAASAGYWWAMAAATRGRARVAGIGLGCAQAEYAMVRDLELMGCDVTAADGGTEVVGGPLRGIEVDMNDHPDSVPALAAVALFARGPTRVRNVRHLRFKETDRLAALARELGKCGARVVEHADGLEIEPPADVRGAEIETYGDHRMAMAFGVVGAAAPGIVIADPDCVSKSYPGFWDGVSRAGVVIRRLP